MGEASPGVGATAAEGKKLHVLIVEDNPATAALMSLFLRTNGHRVDVARNGVETLKAVEADSPDVILLDLGLPKIEDGLEIARQLRGRPTDKRPLLVAITGFGNQEDQRRSMAAGVDLHIVKPADPTQLLDFFERFYQFQE